MRKGSVTALLWCALFVALPFVGSCATQPGTIQCSVQTAGHGLVNPAPTTSSCVLNSQCNSAVKPVCAAPADNTCVCSTRDAGGNCTAGQCVWHVNPAITTCVCVPGQTQRCTVSGAAGVQDCNADGSAWNACTALSSPVP